VEPDADAKVADHIFERFKEILALPFAVPPPKALPLV